MKTKVPTAEAATGSDDVDERLLAGAHAGPWVVETQLGHGGMGDVYAVVHEQIGKRAALKVLQRRAMTSRSSADRMLLEAQVVNRIRHPNIVDIFEAGRLPDGRPYIVMQHLHGQSLGDRAGEGKLLPEQVIAILLQVCDALSAAHARGVIHRDLKLDNVFLVDNPDDPTTPSVKLLDWGIAKVLHHDVRFTIDGQLVGTPHYLAPEQARGALVTPATDVYSLGVMAYELFLGQLPFDAETSAEVMTMQLRALPTPPKEMWPEIPPALEELLLAMLAKQQAHRPALVEVAERLRALRDELRITSQVCDEKSRIASAEHSARSAPSLHANHARAESPAGFAPTLHAEEIPSGFRYWKLIAAAVAGVFTATMLLIRDNTSSTRASPRGVASSSDAQLTRSANAPTPTSASAPVAAEPASAPMPATIEAGPSIVAETYNEIVGARLHKSKVHRAAIERHRELANRHRSKRDRATLSIDPDGTLEAYPQTSELRSRLAQGPSRRAGEAPQHRLTRASLHRWQLAENHPVWPR